MSDTGAGLSILILAAGRGTRMRGADKLLEDVAGVPLLRHLAQTALTLGRPVIVTLPRDAAPARRAALNGLAVHIAEVSDPDAGMAASLVAGIASLPRGCTGAMLLLGDMPEITGEDMKRLAKAFDDAGGGIVLRGGTADGTAGHPVVFPAALFAALAGLKGDRGAGRLLADREVTLVPLPGDHAIRDLDTPEDWKKWREEKGGQVTPSAEN
jgi:CTP:molybdopterin cytidylyltransferase MocA